MAPVGFEPTISVCERPQTYALDRAATGTGKKIFVIKMIGNTRRKKTWTWLEDRSLIVTVRGTLQGPENEELFMLAVELNECPR